MIDKEENKKQWDDTVLALRIDGCPHCAPMPLEEVPLYINHESYSVRLAAKERLERATVFTATGGISYDCYDA